MEVANFFLTFFDISYFYCCKISLCLNDGVLSCSAKSGNAITNDQVFCQGKHICM